MLKRLFLLFFIACILCVFWWGTTKSHVAAITAILVLGFTILFLSLLILTPLYTFIWPKTGLSSTQRNVTEARQKLCKQSFHLAIATLKIMWVVELFILSMIIGYFVSIDPMQNPSTNPSSFFIIGGIAYILSGLTALLFLYPIILWGNLLREQRITKYFSNKTTYPTLFMIIWNLLILVLLIMALM